MAITQWFRDRFCKDPRKGSNVGEDRALTDQFHVTLQAVITQVDTNAANENPKALERINAIQNAGSNRLSWQDAYNIEQQLVHLYDPATLNVELERRLLDAETTLPPSVAQWYRQFADNLSDRESDDQPAQFRKRRVLLARLINDLQWRYTKNEARRSYTKQITARTEFVFILTVIFFLILIIPFILDISSIQWPILEKLKGSSLAHWLKIIPFVGIAGAFGASFSMMTSMKTRTADSSFDDLKLNRTILMISVRVLVGIGSGFLLFFFLRSGLLGGEAFPNLDLLKAHNFSTSAPHLAKLFIWCFIAGFSEKLVPNLLSKTVGQMTKPRTAAEDPGPSPPLPKAKTKLPPEAQQEKPSAKTRETKPTPGKRHRTPPA